MNGSKRLCVCDESDADATWLAEYVDINPDAERTILMVHGWPSLWHSWKYQIEEFKVRTGPSSSQ